MSIIIDNKKMWESLRNSLWHFPQEEWLIRCIDNALWDQGLEYNPETKEIEKQGEQKPTDNEMIEILRAEYEKGRADAIVEMQNPAWSEEDEIRLKHILRLLDVKDDKKYLLMFGLNSLQNLEKDIVWLKSLKDRVQPQPQPVWSKEDDGVLNDIIFNLRHPGVNYYKKPIEDKVSWLNALKSRCCSSSYWKASKKQLETLEFICDNHIFSNDSHRREMESLLKQLKAL